MRQRAYSRSLRERYSSSPAIKPASSPPTAYGPQSCHPPQTAHNPQSPSSHSLIAWYWIIRALCKIESESGEYAIRVFRFFRKHTGLVYTPVPQQNFHNRIIQRTNNGSRMSVSTFMLLWSIHPLITPDPFSLHIQPHRVWQQSGKSS